MTIPPLTFLWAAPMLGGFLALALRSGRRAGVWAVALSAAMLIFCALLPLSQGAALSETGPAWAYGIRYTLSMDGLSWVLCLLTAFLTVISLVASLGEDRSAGYWASFLFLEGALMGVFLVADLFFFYVFWEIVLIPMFFIIGIWGSANRKHAAVKFFLFTFLGSVLMLLGILALVTLRHRATGVWSWDMQGLKGVASGHAAWAIFAALAIGFGVKIPIVPLHTWLPDAHTEAPAAGSIMLAGVMLKMGVYGFLRIAIPIFPDLSWKLLPWLGAIASINVIYGAFCAMAQSDLKRLVAYSSIAHLGFCLIGVFSRTAEGLAGGTLQLINHGLTTGALFLMVGILYERSHHRGVKDFGALFSRAPWLTFFFSVSIMASIGLPGLNGFVGEFMSLAGAARVLPALAVAGAVGVTLAAVYALPAYQSVFWSDPGPSSVSEAVTDLNTRERALLWVLCLAMLYLGLHPAPLLNVISSATGGLAL
ncbi:MAG: complex I subunit 4 family protein [Elusimicrobiota bacterium]